MAFMFWGDGSYMKLHETQARTENYNCNVENPDL